MVSQNLKPHMKKYAKTPKFFKDYYEQKDRMGKKLPAPKIKHTKTEEARFTSFSGERRWEIGCRRSFLR